MAAAATCVKYKSVECSEQLAGQTDALAMILTCRDVRNPRSWKEAQVTRSKDEALQMIQAYRQVVCMSPDPS